MPQCGLRAERTDECRVRRDKSLLLRQERDFEKSESLLFSAVNKFCENADAQCAHRQRFSD